MADGSIIIDTKIDQSGLSKGLKGLGSLASKGLGVITKGVGLMGTALTAAGGFAIKTGMEFDKTMSQVAATWRLPMEEIGAARQAAIDYGASTVFSATEAAQALNYLALAGYGVDQAVDVLPAVLDLAAAGNMDLAYASDLATDAMAALGIEANKENLVEFGDKMAATASHANTSVAQLGEAVLAVGGTAANLANGTDELNTALGVLANRGIKGSEAGTHMRNILLALLAPTDDAAEAMKELGISAVDATTGSLRPLNEVMADFNKATAHMSQDARQQYMSRIFNRYDLAAVEALLAGCGDEWEELMGYVRESDGAMSEMAMTQLDNLSGDVENFSGALESLAIAASDTLNPTLRSLVQLGTSFIDEMTAGLQAGGFTGLASAIGDVLSRAIAAVGDYLPDITQMAVEVIKSLAAGLVTAAPDLGSSAAEIISTLVSGGAEILPDLMQAGLSVATSLGEGLIKSMPTIATDLVSGITGALGELVNAGNEIGGAIVGTLGDLSWEGLAGTIGSFVSGLLDSIVDAIPDAASLLTQIAQTLIDGIVSGITGLASVGSSIMGAIVDALTKANDENVGGAVGKAGADILDGILKGITDIATAPDMSNFMKKIGEGIKEAITFVGDIVGELVGYILSPEGLSAIFDAGVAIVKMLGEGIASAAVGLAKGLGEFVKSISYGLSEAFGFGDPRETVIDQAEAIVGSLGDGISATIDENGNQITAAGIAVADNSEEILSGVDAAIKAGTPAAKAAVDTATKEIVGEVEEQFGDDKGTEIATTFLGAITTTITDGQEELVTTANTVATAALNAIESILSFGNGSAIGKNIASGVATGMSSSTAIIIAAATAMAMSAVYAATDALGIHSPSTVGRDLIGKQFTAGIGVGIVENEGTVLSAIGQLARDMSGQRIGEMFIGAARHHSSSVSSHAQDAMDTVVTNSGNDDSDRPGDDYDALGQAIARHMPRSFTLEDIDGEYIGTIAEPTVSEVQAQKVNIRRG